MNHATWILVLDAYRARLFEDHPLKGGLEEVKCLTSPGGREHIKDQVSDRAGLKPAGGQGNRVGASQEVDPREAHTLAFVHHVADFLKTKRNAQAYQELVIAAPPHILGLLRKTLDESVARSVVASFDKDYIHLNGRDLSKRIHAAVR